ncbi:MAG: 50S ribosomal protein L13 [Deltaproteobacteria bacterium]|nr:50S ribosomal protein L13 [Deltaproteobacteria bacterium]
MMSTQIVPTADIDRSWYVVDLQNKVLGRAATEIARVLRGKHKAVYANHVDAGDFVIVINADKVHLTGKKLTDKFYYRHSGYPGGIRSTSAGKLLEEKPEEVIRIAVKGMLPKNKLGRQMFKKLKVYRGSDHPHEAQKPQALTI